MLNKTILIVVDTGFVARSLLRSDFLPLIKEKFKRVVILVPQTKIAYYREHFQKDNVVIDAIIPCQDGFLKRKFFTLLRFSIPTQGSKIRIMRNLFWRKGFKLSGWLVYFIPILSSWYLARFKLWRVFLRKLYSLIKPNEEYLTLFKKHKVDVFFVNYAPLLAGSPSLKLIKAAKKLGILTIGNIETWDNLGCKVFITEQTDFLTVPNQVVKEEAIKLGDFKEGKIGVVGLPCFDFYAKKEKWLLPREEFFQQIGADPNKRLILFAAGLRSFGVNYDHFFDYFAQMADHYFKDIQFYFRPHPKYYFNEQLVEKYSNTSNLIFQKKPGHFLGKDFELTQEDNQLLFNLFYHCHLVICIFSTFLIESCLMQKPVINLAYAGSESPYYYRFTTYLQFDHLANIFKRDFAKLARSDQELLAAVKLYLENPAQDSQARTATAQEQMFLTNGQAAKRLTETIVRFSAI